MAVCWLSQYKHSLSRNTITREDSIQQTGLIYREPTELINNQYKCYQQLNFCLFVWVEALRPSQQFFSHVGTETVELAHETYHI